MATSRMTLEAAWRLGASFLAHKQDAISIAQVLLSHLLRQNRAYLYAHADQVLAPSLLASYQALLEKSNQGVPLAYLSGAVEFYSHHFMVNEDVLIPRPETEMLVEHAIQLLLHANAAISQPQRVLDLGTGSGAIAISIALACQNTKVLATDVSLDALLVAEQNAKYHGVTNVTFLQSDWFSAIPNQSFDCIISNPPYLTLAEWQTSTALHHEPARAFIGGEDGLSPYRAIADGAKKFLKSGGVLLFEHGATQAAAVRDILQEARYSEVFSAKDLSGHDRLTIATAIDQ